MKKLTSWLTMGLFAVLLGVVVTVNANAQETGEDAVFTLTEPLDVGGTILQPGSYQIKVVPLHWNRDLLQVRSADLMKLHANVLTVPHQEGPEGVQVEWSRYVYYPAIAGQPRALKTWFAANTPGSGGHDIVYPTRRAMELAAQVKEPVVAIPDEVKVAEYETAPLVLVTPEKEVKPFEVAKTAEVAKAPEPPMTELAPARPEIVADSSLDQQQLPATASRVPLVAGLGLLSLAGALGLGVIARRLA